PKSKPSAVSRVSVSVVLLESMSTSPDCSAVKRCWAVRGTYLTFSESPKITAETARQTSTSSPTHLPWLSARAKPATPVGTPQITEPRALMASTSLPARAAVETRRAAAPAAAANEALYMVASLLSSPGAVSPCEGKQATGQLRLRLGAPPERRAPCATGSAGRTAGRPGSTAG